MGATDSTADRRGRRDARMTASSTVIDQVDSVCEAAADPQGAYLIRSRLRRMLLNCARQVAELQGVQKPVYPGQWVVVPGAPDEIQKVMAVCRRVYQRSEHLCQPSESFDVRWEDGWRELSADLENLQNLLSRLR